MLGTAVLAGDTVTQDSAAFSLDTRLPLEPVDPGSTVTTLSDSFVLDTRLILSNTDPVFPPIADQQIPENTPWNFQLVASDAEFPRQAVTFSKVAGPEALTVSPAGIVAWTPGDSFGGSRQSVEVRVSDGMATVQRAFQVVVLEDEQNPQLAPIADATVRQGQLWTATAQGSDPDLPAQKLTYSLVTGPDGFTVDPASGGMSWTPSAAQTRNTYSITIRVTDPTSRSSELTFQITVPPPILRVPQDFATIQQAINAAGNGDTVLVAPGQYRENLVIRKPISLIAEAGQSGLEEDILKTVIDGGLNGKQGIHYESPDGNSASIEATLNGFVVRNCSDFGVYVERAYPAHIKNVISEKNGGGYWFNHWRFPQYGPAKQVAANLIARDNGERGFYGTCNNEIVLLEIKSYRNRLGIDMGCAGVHWIIKSLIAFNTNAFSLESPRLINTTCAYNGSPGSFGSGQGGNALIRNSILMDEGAYGVQLSAAVDIDYSVVKGGKTAISVDLERHLKYGPNNISIDPKFVSPSMLDFRLRDESLAIGAGGPLPVNCPESLMPEPAESSLDIGAIENPRAYPAVPEFSVFGAITHNVCAGDSLGAIKLFVANGQEPLGFSWTGPEGFSSASRDLTQLRSGTYRVTVSSSGSATSNSFIVREPATLRVISTVCGGFPNVLLTLKPGGGTPPYSLLWDQGGTGFEKTVQEPGEYWVSLSDAAGCQVREKIVVPAVLGPRTFFVAPSGDDSNLGTRENPLRTLDSAIDRACNSDVIVLMRGEYFGPFDLQGKAIRIQSDYSGAYPSEEDIKNTLLSGNPRYGVIGIPSGASLSGVSVRNGRTGVGLDGGVVQNCYIFGNYADGDSAGGGLLMRGNSFARKCKIFGNTARHGSGVTTFGNSTLQVVEDCQIYGNLTFESAGQILVWGGRAQFKRCIIEGTLNWKTLEVRGRGESLFHDCVIINSETASAVEAWESGSSSFENCSIISKKPGGFCVEPIRDNSNCSFTFKNCVFYNRNLSATAWIQVSQSILFPAKGSEAFIQQNPSLIVSDPKFISPSTGDYRLRDDSPAINAGDNSVVTDPKATDLDGRKRILGGRVDLGAYERWTFYPERSLTAAEGATATLDPSAEDLNFFGGVTFLKESGPQGLSVEPSTGRLTWSPTEADAPGTYTAVIRGTVSNNPSATDTQTLTLIAQEVNQAPVFAEVGPQSVEERQTWTLTLKATDPDLPAKALSYRLVQGPSGVSVQASTGVVQWTPGEAEGGRVHELVFEVTDAGEPPLSTQKTVQLEVRKVNHPPTLAPLADATVAEGSPFRRTVAGADADLPEQVVIFGLPVHPEGMTIESGTGAIVWTPSEAQGPGTYPVTVRVSDPGGLSAEQSFQITVTEVNTAPQWEPIADAILVPGKNLSLTLKANDADQPANTLTYRLAQGPTNAVVTPSGQFSWTPERSQAPSTNRIAVAVSDGTLSVTNVFTVEVVDLVLLVNGQPTTNTVGSLPPVQVAFQHSKDDWLVFYSVDGTEPTASSFFYLEPQRLETSSTVWPVLFAPDFSASVLGLPVRVNVWTEQSLTVTGGEGLVHQGPGVAILASASSGLTVSLAVVSGPGRLENGLLVPTGGGTIRLRATQAGDEVWAPASVEVERTVSAAAQSITWTAVADATFGDAPLTLKATASSGLPVGYSVVSGPGSVSGDRLTLTGAGTVVVRATQSGTVDFQEATAETTVTVAKSGQTLSFAALANRAFTTNGIPLVGNASSGLPVAFEVLSGAATVQGTQLFLSGVGTVVVRASQLGNANYEAALPKDQTFTVSQGTQTLTFTPVGAKTYGDAPVTLVATSSSGLPVTFRVLSGPGTVSGTTLTLTGAGSILVQATQAGDARYAAANGSQTVAVAKAAQTLTFPALSNTAYTTNPIPLNATASSGLPVAYRVVGGSATVSGNALRLGGVGTIAVAADQAGDGNHLAAPSRTNSFTVSRGVQTITFTPIGDQVLGGPVVTLTASSSAGLPVTFSVLSGPATVSGSQLTLLNEGAVTVRALNPGSPVWLAAQVDQTFQIKKLTTLTVTVAGGRGGSVTVSPLKERYEPSEVVTFSAVPAEGYRFENWSGALSGTANPTTLVMSVNRVVEAVFQDIQAPVLTWDLPVAGTTSDENAVLSGRVTDNAPDVTATWSRDGGAAQALAVSAEGVFRVEGVVLGVGANRFAVTVKDAAGNASTSERTVTWAPERVLRVANAAEVQEGQRIVYAVQMISTGSTVAGLTFRLRYDPAWLADPQVEWGALVGQSVNNLNLGTPGEIGGSFALAGTALPAGTNPVATVSFRARSVPGATNPVVTPQIESVSGPTGAAWATGNAGVSGEGRILPRKIRGDNNANQRIDVGDAVVISRLQVNLEEKRPWDIPLNDLNDTKTIDSGDVVKALRYVVGLDAQPKAAPRSGELSVESRELREEGVTQLSTLNSQQRRQPLRLAGNTNDVLGLEFPDGDTAKPGVPWRLVVKLARAGSTISGLSFTVSYPQSVLTLTGKQVGALVPSDSLPLWAENPGSVSLAAVRSTAWPTSTGVAAVLTFLPGPGITGQATWPLVVSQAEITGSGFDIRPVDTVNAVVKGGGAPPLPPAVVVTPPSADGKLNLQVEAPVGAEVVLETTTDLSSWSVSQRATGQGAGKPVTFPVVPENGTVARFWRVRVP